jgi:hypothetical protein
MNQDSDNNQPNPTYFDNISLKKVNFEVLFGYVYRVSRYLNYVV